MNFRTLTSVIVITLLAALAMQLQLAAQAARTLMATAMPSC